MGFDQEFQPVRRRDFELDQLRGHAFPYPYRSGGWDKECDGVDAAAEQFRLTICLTIKADEIFLHSDARMP